jgi:hypothetical protein
MEMDDRRIGFGLGDLVVNGRRDNAPKDILKSSREEAAIALAYAFDFCAEASRPGRL